MLVIGCKNKKIFKGFTLIELLVVLLIIGISTTLITLSFNTVSSIEKQTNSVEEYSRLLAEESIVSGNIVAWYFNSTNQYATFVSENGVEKKISNLDNSIWEDSSSISKTFTYFFILASNYQHQRPHQNHPLSHQLPGCISHI